MGYIGKQPTSVPLTSDDVADGIITSAKIANGTIATADIADGAVTSVKTTGVGGANTPAFEAFLSANVTLNDATDTKIQFNTEVFDSDGCYDNTTNYRFTPTTAGKYLIYAKVAFDDGPGNVESVFVDIYKNGSNLSRSFINFDTSTTDDGEGASPSQSIIVDMNGSTDYVEVFVNANHISGSNTIVAQGSTTEYNTVFGGFKLIT